MRTAAALVTLVIVPYLVQPEVRSFQFKPFPKIFSRAFVSNTFVLGWIGAKPVEHPFLEIGQITTALYPIHSYVLQFAITTIEDFMVSEELCRVGVEKYFVEEIEEYIFQPIIHKFDEAYK